MLQQTFPDEVSNQQHGALDSDCFVDAAAMKLHCSRGNIEPSSNLFGGQSICHHKRDFNLPLREFHSPSGRRRCLDWRSIPALGTADHVLDATSKPEQSHAIRTANPFVAGGLPTTASLGFLALLKVMPLLLLRDGTSQEWKAR
jgi:hypothetical protein